MLFVAHYGPPSDSKRWNLLADLLMLEALVAEAGLSIAVADKARRLLPTRSIPRSIMRLPASDIRAISTAADSGRLLVGLNGGGRLRDDQSVLSRAGLPTAVIQFGGHLNWRYLGIRLDDFSSTEIQVIRHGKVSRYGFRDEDFYEDPILAAAGKRARLRAEEHASREADEWRLQRAAQEAERTARFEKQRADTVVFSGDESDSGVAANSSVSDMLHPDRLFQEGTIEKVWQLDERSGVRGNGADYSEALIRMPLTDGLPHGSDHSFFFVKTDKDRQTVVPLGEYKDLFHDGWALSYAAGRHSSFSEEERSLAEEQHRQALRRAAEQELENVRSRETEDSSDDDDVDGDTLLEQGHIIWEWSPPDGVETGGPMSREYSEAVVQWKGRFFYVQTGDTEHSVYPLGRHSSPSKAVIAGKDLSLYTDDERDDLDSRDY